MLVLEHELIYLQGLLVLEVANIYFCKERLTMSTLKSSKIFAVKETTQIGYLERPLTYLRTRKILPFCVNKNVLDFGCGRHLNTAKAVKKFANKVVGVDQIFGDGPGEVENEIFRSGTLEPVKKLGFKFDVILSLACFEHLYENELVELLEEIKSLLAKNAIIVGTVPTPAAKPILEFLSYKLGWIDPSQIEDHKVYYDKELLEKVVARVGFKLNSYKRFQFGMNSLFQLSL